MNENMNNNPFDNGVPTGQPVTPEVPVQAPVEPVQAPVTPEPVQQVPVEPVPTPVTPVEPIPTSTPNVEIPSQGISQNVPTQAPKKSKKGLIIGLISGIVAIGAIVVFLFLFIFNKGSGPMDIAKTYVNNLINKKYSDNYELVYLPDKNYVEKDDYLTFAQTKKEYEKLSNFSIQSIEEKIVKDNDITYNVILSDNGPTTNSMIIKLKKKDKDWKVEESDFYITDWTIVIPGGTDLYINDVKVDQSLFSENKTKKEKVDVKIPAIYSQEKAFKLVNPLETKTERFTPLKTNSGEEIYLELTDTDLTQKAYDYIKNTWNEMYTSYINGVDVSEIASKYFDSSMSIESVNTYYKAAFDSITEGTSGYKYENYNLLEVINGKDTNYVLDKDIITINFGYKLSWNWTFSIDSNVRTMTRYSKIRLKIDGESFKIYEVPDEKFFTWTNSFTHEY